MGTPDEAFLMVAVCCEGSQLSATGWAECRTVRYNTYIGDILKVGLRGGSLSKDYVALRRSIEVGRRQ